MTDWRFYGRDREIRVLRKFMDEGPAFDTIAVRGRRQVGKSLLVGHFFRNRRNASPVIICHLADAGGPSLFLHFLKAEVMDVRPDLLDGFRPTGNDVFDFPRLTRHLLERGCTVVLDEFQRIDFNGTFQGYLPSLFQKVLDDMKHSWDSGAGRGADQRSRFVVMGSQQQKLMDMFHNPAAPMFNRIRKDLHLKPWTFPEIAEMARDREWDGRPYRLLTLWTAYGGMPDHWQRFSENGALSDFSRRIDDQDWVDGFLLSEERYRNTLHGSFDRQMEIQLRPLDRETLAWLAERPGGQLLHNPPSELRRKLAEGFREAFPEKKGTPDRQAAAGYLDDAIGKRLSGSHLGLLEKRNAIDDYGAQRWHVADSHARFQLDVLEHAVRWINEGPPMSPGAVRRLLRERMERMEGSGLETLAVSALDHLFTTSGLRDGIALQHGAWRRDPPAEIDFLAEDETVPQTLWVGSCKRMAKGHDPEADWGNLWNYLKPVAEGSREGRHLDGIREYQRNFVFVSPVFDDAAKQRLAARAAGLNERNASVRHGIAGWFTMDIPDMLEGKGPQPLQLPGPMPPEDGRSDFGM